MGYVIAILVAFAFGYGVAAVMSVAHEQSEWERLLESLSFTVIDKQTGKRPDMESIARNEEWAKGLMADDMEGFALEDDGDLVLMDECGNFTYCPRDRFEIHPETEIKV